MKERPLPGRERAGWQAATRKQDLMRDGKAVVTRAQQYPPNGQRESVVDRFSRKEQRTPERHQQSLTALRRANEIRHQRSQARLAVDRGERPIDELIVAPPDFCAKVPAFELIQWVRGVGYARARKIARGVVTETLPVCSMSPTTRAQLLDRLEQSRNGVLL